MTTFFSSIAKNIVRSLSAKRACDFGAMTEGNIYGTDRKNFFYCFYYPNMLKTYQRQSKLFEFF